MVGKLKLIGLTGGIGSGKSTVGRMIAALGVPVLDADQIAREVVAPGQPAHAEIAAAFPDVMVPGPQADPARVAGSTIDRRRLAARVFNDAIARKRLEAITHPRIQARAQELAEALEAAGHRLAFYEASLLVETGRYGEFDGLVVVSTSEAMQIARAMGRDGASRAEIEARLKAQLPLAEKRKLATAIIDNEGDLAATRAQVEALVHSLIGESQEPPHLP